MVDKSATPLPVAAKKSKDNGDDSPFPRVLRPASRRSQVI